MAEGLTDHEQYLRRIEAFALATLPIAELPLVAASDHHDGVMVALVPDDPERYAIDHPDALPADDLHVSLCVLGKVQDLTSFDQTRILSKARSVCDSVGRSFDTNVDGVVVMGKNDEGVPATALLIQSDEIVALYEAMAKALNYESKFPTFIPHMTAGYGVPVDEVEQIVGNPIRFSKVIVKFGDAVHEVPLPGALVAAPRAANVIDRVIDSLGRLWDEALHPRDREGKFVKKNGAVSGKLAVPTRDRKSVTMVDANRASVVGFHTFGNDIWVLAEITNPDGSKTQGFARADNVSAVAPVKARLDALYPVQDDDTGDAFLNASLERKRQLDLILAHITSEYGPDNDSEGAMAFLETLGLTDRDLDYVFGDDNGVDDLGGIRRVDRVLSDDELDEQEDIIEDARTVKTLRDRVHGLQQDGSSSGSREFDGPEVQRGIAMVLSEDEYAEIQRLLRLPKSPDEIDQEYKIGPMLVELAKKREGGIGNNWTTKPEMAETATMFNRPEGKVLSVIFTASIRKDDIETRPEMMRDMHGDTEGEVRLVPGSDVEIHDVKIKDGQKWRSVWKDEQEVSLEPHVVPKQQLPGDEVDPDIVSALKGGEDPFSLSTNNLLSAMDESGRFERRTPTATTGVSPIDWLVDPAETTGHNVRLAGTGSSTTDRAYFVKQSVIGAEFGNTDVVNEVVASLMAENVAEIVGSDDSRLLKIPRSVFGDNPEWDGTSPPGSGDPFNDKDTHQPAHVVSQHVGYLIPTDWGTTDAATEENALRNDIRDLDAAAQVDQRWAFYEDIGDLYGNSITKMVLWDFVILNGDRNPGNAILAHSPDHSEGVVLPIDHGFSFDEPFALGDAKGSFDWFMNWALTRAWLNYVRGGLDINNNVTEASLRQMVQDFVDTYGRMDTASIVEALRSTPGVKDDQVQRIEEGMAGVVDRLRWISDNMDAVLQKIIERTP